jgi:O-antigen/teichoic acid export membrane protein
VSAEETRKNSGIARHSLIYAVSNVARQLAGFLMLPIYTSYLSPADYGAVGLLAFALALLEPFFGARLMQAIPKFYFEVKSEQSKGAVISSALILTASVSAVSATMVYMFNEEASNLLFGTTEYALATALFGLNILTQPVEYSGMMFIRIQERSLLYLAVSMAKLVVQISLNLLLVVYFEMGVVGVVLSGVIASTIFGIILTIYTFYYNKPSFDWPITLKMLIFCWPLWFAGLAGLYIGSSNRLYLRIFSSLDDVGLIELATRFASLLGLLIWGPFIQHWELVSYKYYNEDRSSEVFQSAFLGINTLLIIVGLGISVFSEPVIELMSSAPFHGSAQLVPLLTLGFMLNSIASFFYFSFMVTDRPKLFTYCHYFTAAVITIVYLAMIPAFGVIGAAAGQALAYGINLLFAFYISRRLLNQGIKLSPVFFMIFIAAVFYVMSNIVFSQDDFVWDSLVKVSLYICAVLILCGVSYVTAKRINGGENSLLEFVNSIKISVDRYVKLKLPLRR